MSWWLIEFDGVMAGQPGYLKMENDTATLYLADGTEVIDPCDYHTIEVDVPAPDWSA